MRCLRKALFPFMTCLVVVALTTSVVHGELTKNQIKILENEFLPAWNVGNTFVVLESLNKAVRTMDEEQLAELDALLLKQGIPASGELLVESRLALLQQMSAKDLSKPGLRETALTFQYVRNEIDTFKESSSKLSSQLTEALSQPSFDKLESLLWDMHVMSQQAVTSIKQAEYAVELRAINRRFKPKQIAKLPEAQQEIMDFDFDASLEQLQTIQRDLAENRIVARWQRLKYSVDVLGKADASRTDQFLAAWSVNQDSQLLNEALQAAGEVPFRHPELKDNQLAELLGPMIAKASELASDELQTKSRLLFEGMHWWYRGRYGMGTYAFGILKGPEAVTSDQAAFALMMPTEPPTPTDPAIESRYPVPELDRRHHYIWAWEYRTVTAQTTKDSKIIASSERRLGSITHLSRFY